MHAQQQIAKKLKQGELSLTVNFIRLIQIETIVIFATGCQGNK